IADEADAEMSTRGACLPLLLAQEPLIADRVERLVQGWDIVAAVVGERREVLIDDLVVVREGIRRDEVAPADFGSIKADLACSDVEQPLHYEHAVLAACTTNRRDQSAIGEHRAEAAFVSGDVVAAEERALAVERDRQAT